MENNERQTYLAAVSGGPDSMALLDMLAKEDKYRLIVCHVNYKTREESDSEELLVRNYCKEHGLLCYVTCFDNQYEGSFEDAARKFRYQFFSEIYQKENAKGLFVAHHKDDLLETYLLKKRRNVVNESYLINKKTVINKMNVLRPLLTDYYKEDLLNYCNSNHIPYGIDKTNFMDIHPRNVIRKEIAKMDKEKLYEEALKEEKNLSDTRKEVKEFIKFYPVYDVNLLKDKNELWLRIFIYEACSQKFRKYINKACYLSLLDFLASKKANLEHNIKDNYYMIKSYGTIVFDYIRKGNYSYSLGFMEKMKTRYFEIKDTGLKMQGIYVTESDFPLTIRSYDENDVVKLKEGNKKISRLFIDKKVPLYKRNTIPVIVNSENEVIFVYGLYRKYGYKNVRNNLYLALKS